MGKNVQSVSHEIGYSKASIYTWRKKHIQEGCTALMKPPNERERGELKEGTPAASKEIALLKIQVQNMQLEMDILMATLDVLKKAPASTGKFSKTERRQ